MSGNPEKCLKLMLHHFLQSILWMNLSSSLQPILTEPSFQSIHFDRIKCHDILPKHRWWSKSSFEAMLYGKFLICWIIYLSFMCHYSLLSNSLPHLWQKFKLNIPSPVSHKSCDALNCYSNGYSLRGNDLSNSTLVPNKIHERLA